MAADRSASYRSVTLGQNGGIPSKAFASSVNADYIGLNKNSHQLEGSDYVSWEMAGMVSLGMGENGWAGGGVNADAAFNFHLPKATLSIDEKTIVKDGKLQ